MRTPLSQALGAALAAAAPAPVDPAARRLHRQLCTEAERASKGRACGAPACRIVDGRCEAAFAGPAAGAVARQVARRFAAVPGWGAVVEADGARAVVRLSPLVEAGTP